MPPSSRPPVAIGLPVYNGANHLADALASLTAQTFTDIDIVVCDNASSDDTVDIANEFAANDPRVRVLRNERNLGANGNYNRVFHETDSPYFKWAAHDDLCAPRFVESCLDALTENPSAVLAHPLTELIDASGELLDVPCAEAADTTQPDPVRRFRNVMLDEAWCFPIFGVARREAVAHTDLHQPYFGTDKVLLAHLALMGPLLVVDEVLFQRRCHAAQASQLSVGEAKGWAASANPRAWRTPVPLQLLDGYVGAVRHSAVSAVAKTRAFAAVAEMTARFDKRRKRAALYDRLNSAGSVGAGRSPLSLTPTGGSTLLNKTSDPPT